MLHHRAFGRHLDTLTVAVIDNRPPILSLMRAMLAAIGTGRIETYDSATEALHAMAEAIAVIMSVRANPTLVEAALRAGAHQVLVLPTTASTLYRRLDWLISDDRPFELKGQHYVVAGMEERLSLSFQRPVYVPAGAPEPGRDRRKKAHASPR